METRKEFVWFPAEDDSEWVLCQLLSRTPSGGAALRFGKRELVVSPEDEHLILPRPGLAAQNHASLEKDGLGAGRVEDAIRNQFCATNPYSNINMVTLCTNPFRMLKIFGEAYVEKYSALDPALPPHIFNASANAYKRSMDKKENQVLLLLGDGCSGKSTAFEHLLSFFDQTAGDGQEEFQQMLAILAPLISAQLRCNRQMWLSTRAIVEVELGLAADGFTCRTLATVRMLETERLARSMSSGFKNFDAFYLAAKDERAEEWLGATEYRLLGDEIEIEEYDDEGQARKKWMEALVAFGIDDAAVVQILCGLILLGELTFHGTEGSLHCEPEGALDAAATALGVNAGSLLAALIAGVTTAGDVVQRVNAVVAEVYSRLVDLVLRLTNEHIPAEAKAITRRIKVVEFPSASDAPGVHGLLTQLLNEARFVRMLRIARGPAGAAGDEMGELRDESELQVAAQEAEALCRGCLGAVRAEPSQLLAWAQAQDASNGFSFDGKVVSVSGACGRVQHEAGSLLSGAAIDKVPLKDIFQVLAQSSCKYLRDIAGLPLQGSRVTDAAEAADEVLSYLEPQQGLKTWLICCLRPNDGGYADRVNRDVMLRQTRHLRLADMVQLTEKNYCFVWSLKAFRAKYADLGPGLAASTPDEEVCRIIVKSAGGDEGTVGSENVFGGKILEQLLEHKLQEKMAGAQHLEGTKSEMKLLMEEKLKAETIQREQQQERLKELESLRGQHEDHQNKQQLLMQQLQEQQLQLQRQQQEQMEALRKQQEMELERLRKQQEEASAAAVAALEAAKEKEAPPAPVHPTDPTLRRPTEAAGAPSSRPSRIRRQTTDHSLHSLHALRFRIPTGSPEEEGRPRQNHPALHAALAQMAAILRVAKEREQNFKASEEFQDQMLRDLQAERDGWKQEIQMLTEQVGDLRQSLEDPSWQRRPGSGSLHAALCPPEVMDQPGRSP